MSLFVNFSEAPERIKAHYTLSSLIVGEGVDLKLKGKEWVGLCPFHDEKTPSFSVNDAKGVYFCRGCGETGDVIAFIAQHRGLSTGRAIRQLAHDMGLSINASPDRTHQPAKSRQRIAHTDREAIIHVHDHVAQVAHRYLLDLLQNADHPLTRYLFNQRQMPVEHIVQYGLGFLPGDQPLRALVKSSSVKPAGEVTADDAHWEVLAIEAGLHKAGYHKSMFQERLLFPITDTNGRCVAFSGRLIPGMESSAMLTNSKYLNSPDTLIFNKSQSVFGLTPWHVAMRDAVAARLWRQRLGGSRWAMVEGYTDVMRLAQCGVMSVAAMGTAVTEEHMQQLLRRVQTLCVVTDGDEAGRSAATRSLLRAFAHLSAGQSLYAAYLPAGEDPDTFFSEVADGPGPSEHVWHLINGLPHDTPEAAWFAATVDGVASPVSLSDQVRIERALAGQAGVPVPQDPLVRLALVRYVADQTGYYTRPLASVRSAFAGVDDQRRWVLDDSMRFWMRRIARAPHILPAMIAPWRTTWWVRDCVNGLLAAEMECPGALRLIFQAGLALSRVPDYALNAWPELAEALLEARFPSSLLVLWAEVINDNDHTLSALGYDQELLAPELWMAEFEEWVAGVDARLSAQLRQAVSLDAPVS